LRDKGARSVSSIIPSEFNPLIPCQRRGLLLFLASNSCGLLVGGGCAPTRKNANRDAPAARRDARQPMLDKKQKEKLIAEYRTHESDTGSPQVQVAILTAEIEDLSKHLLDHKKDFSSRRGLLRKVSERRRLLKYLEREDAKAHAKLVEKLGLRA